MFPFAKCIVQEHWNRASGGGSLNEGRNVVPVFSERLKKFKSNANEGEELNISGWQGVAEEERKKS